MDPAVRAARAALAKNPLNVGAWNEVLRLSVREPPEKRREVFEEYLELFPTRASVWRQYIEFEIAHKHYEQTKELFKRCLMKCPFIGLWELYIKFLEDTNTPREEMLSALKLAVDTMKPDIDSYSLWRKYINLFKNEPTDGKRPHEVSRLTMDTRSLYQTSIALPHRGVDKIWKEYLDWETNMNQAIASKYTKEKGPLHSNARAVTAKIEQLCRRLRKDFPSLPPEMRDGILAEQQRLWEQLVAYERSNPLKLDHDHLVVERVYFVYRQYLLCFNRYPTVWYEAAMYLHDAARAAQTKGDTESAERWQGAANALLAEGRTACPADLILHFAHADLLETQANIPEAKKIYKSLLAQPDLPNATLVYVQFLKHTRRTEGVKAAREVFKAARSDDRVDHHVYTASAMMELASGPSGNQICRKIFEKGMEKFSASPSYADAFLSFMSYMGDSNNTRALFERFLAKVPSEEAGSIWERYIKFESLHGDLSSVLRLEQRQQAADEALRVQAEVDANRGVTQRHDEHTMDHLMSRYRFRELLPCPREHMYLFQQDQPSSGAETGSAPPAGSAIAAATTATGPGSAAAAQADAGANLDVTFAAYPTPDTSQLIPFKPVLDRDPGMFLVRPPHVADLMRQLPPPHTYNGPPVDTDALLRLIRDTKVPDLTIPDPAAEGKRRASGAEGHAAKRAKEGTAATSASSSVGALGPGVDVFTARQLQRQKQNAMHHQ